jgi:hypothetical protein
MADCTNRNWQSELLTQHLVAKSRLSQTPPSYVPTLYHTEYQTWANLPEIGYDADVSKLYNLKAFAAALKTHECSQPAAPTSGLGATELHPFCERELRLTGAALHARLRDKVAAGCQKFTGQSRASCMDAGMRAELLKDTEVRSFCKVPTPFIDTTFKPSPAGTSVYTGEGGWGGKILDEYRVKVTSVSGADVPNRSLLLGALAVAVGIWLGSR